MTRNRVLNFALSVVGAGIVWAWTPMASAEPLNPPGNVTATYSASQPGVVSLSWDAVANATSYEIWGKISDPAVLGFYPAGYTGYNYYPAFSNRLQRFVRIGTTTANTFALQYAAYSSYMAYSEYNEYSFYGCYRVVALSTTLPIPGNDGATHFRGLPSAEVHPSFSGNDLNPPSYVLVNPNSSGNTVTVSWDAVSGATNYEIYAKMQNNYVNTTAANGVNPNVTPLVWNGNPNDGSAFHPYFGYSSYNSFLAAPNYTQYLLAAVVDSSVRSVNINYMTLAGGSGAGAYHEYSSYMSYGGYSAYSAYTEYGVFKVVAQNWQTLRRSPPSAESVLANAASASAVAARSGGGGCFLGTARRRQ